MHNQCGFQPICGVAEIKTNRNCSLHLLTLVFHYCLAFF